MKCHSIFITALHLVAVLALPTPADINAAAPNMAPSAVTTGTAAAAPQEPQPSTPSTNGANIQIFTGALGGPPPPVLQAASGTRPFTVDGNTFVGSAGALGRSCDLQHNSCADEANDGGAFSVAECDTQNAACHTANMVRRRLVGSVR